MEGIRQLTSLTSKKGANAPFELKSMASQMTAPMLAA
jgi:hypothetical protein